MLQVTDSFTTMDGEWYPSSKPYAISEQMVEKYHIPMDLGGATHIYVRAPYNAVVMFYTLGPGGKENVYTTSAGLSGWANMGMTHSSAYVPGRGEVGPWHVDVNGVNVASGIGLPDGLHVSTFLVVEDVPVDVPVPGPEPKRLRVLVNEEVLLDAWV